MSFLSQAFACDAVVKLLEEFLFGDHKVEKLVAIDDYNALYWKTKYFNWKSAFSKDMIPAENVTLVTFGQANRIDSKACVLGKCIPYPRDK